MDIAWQDKCDQWLAEMQDHLREELLPFWFTRGVDTEYGGFLTYFDADGDPTGETDKTLVCQLRMIFTFSEIERFGFGNGQALGIAQQGFEFLIENFWDDTHGGWFWVVAQDGTPINRSKLGYGHTFAMLALSEYGMASGDIRALDFAVKTFETIQTFAADNLNGGYYEFHEEDWRKKAPGVYGGDRKSMDVHMHVMEALTNMYEATGAQVYRDRCLEVIDLIFARMLHPEHRTSYMQFLPDWTPSRALIFKNVWGSDRDVDDPEGRPLNNTSYGHNTEFVWLLNHAIHILDLDAEKYRPTMNTIMGHAMRNGVDWDNGGLYCEGPMDDGAARETNKEFWQQAEVMIALLDGYITWNDPDFLKAYENIHRFVFDHGINHEVGEWYPLFDKDNNRLDDYMGHAWKINYHTVRAVLLCEKKLLKLTMSNSSATTVPAPHTNVE